MTTKDTPQWVKDLMIPLIAMAISSLATGTITHAITVSTLDQRLKSLDDKVKVLESQVKSNADNHATVVKTLGEQNAALQRWMGGVDVKLDMILDKREGGK